MDKFDFWLTLILGIFFLITGIVGIRWDYRKRSPWWRWGLDILSIIIGTWFIYGCFCIL